MPSSDRILAVMFTDMKGFTARTATSSRADLVSLLEQHERLVLPIVTAYGGTLVKSIGDAFLCVFESPTNAVLTAIQIQERLRSYNQTAVKGQAIELRIGINVGEVTIVNNDVFGDVVNVASRVEAVTEPMEIMLTQSVTLAMNREEIGKLLDHYNLRLGDSGSHELKGVRSPVRLYHIQNRAAVKRRPTAKLATTATPNHHAVDAMGRRLAAFGTATISVACLLATAIALLLLATAVLFTSRWLGILALMALVVAFPWGLWSRRFALVRLSSGIVLVSLALLLPDTIVRDMQRHLDGLAGRLGQSTPATFSSTDKLSIYIASVSITALTAARGEKASATEQFYLYFPGAEIRRWRSRHLLGDCVVRSALGGFARGLERATSARVEMSPRVLPMARPENRTPSRSPALRAAAIKHLSDWVIEVTAAVTVSYQAGGHVRLLTLGGATLSVDTGVLAMLQDAGWLFPYVAEYEWTLQGDDGRLLQGCDTLRTAALR